VDARIFAWADLTVRKGIQRYVVLQFVDAWTKRTRQAPADLVFDSGFTIYKNLDELNNRNIHFITRRRRFPALRERIQSIPAEEWRKIRLNDCGGNPRVVDEETSLKDYEDIIRQILVRGLGHLQPTVLITNQK